MFIDTYVFAHIILFIFFFKIKERH